MAERRRAREIGPAGRDGIDGKSVSLDEALGAMCALRARSGPRITSTLGERLQMQPSKQIIGEALAAIPTPVNGKDGAPGVDGRSVSLDEIEAIVERRLELKFAAYVVEHERRLPDVLQRMIDQIEKPRDGINGRNEDGRDGKDGKHGEDGFRPPALRR